jgi:hypothetical protein
MNCLELPLFPSLFHALFFALLTHPFYSPTPNKTMEIDNNNDDWPIDQTWLEIDKRMTYETFEENDTIKSQDWIWFDDNTPFGCCMCINSRDTHQYAGNTLKTLLDHATVDGNTYTLTQKIVMQGNKGIYTQTPWDTAYRRFSQFAEWGYQMMVEGEYKNIHQIRTSGKKLDDFIKAGIRFSHIIHVKEEMTGFKRR